MDNWAQSRLEVTNRCFADNRNVPFYLEGNMPRGFKGFQKGHPYYLNSFRWEKGNIPWNKEKKWSKEIRKKLSESHKNKKIPEEIKRKMSIIAKERGTGKWMKGKKFSTKWKENISKGHKGEKSYLWKGGISRTYKTGYNSFEYKQWRQDVFIRDEFTCRECGKKHIYITAHHIKSFAKFPKLRFDINNGLTLCEECHKLTDNYKGKKSENQKRN